jgi:hypothetical protein
MINANAARRVGIREGPRCPAAGWTTEHRLSIYPCAPRAWRPIARGRLRVQMRQEDKFNVARRRSRSAMTNRCAGTRESVRRGTHTSGREVTSRDRARRRGNGGRKSRRGTSFPSGASVARPRPRSSPDERERRVGTVPDANQRPRRRAVPLDDAAARCAAASLAGRPASSQLGPPPTANHLRRVTPLPAPVTARRPGRARTRSRRR